VLGINSSSDRYIRRSALNAFWKESNEALLRDLATRKERLTAEAERRLSRYRPFFHSPFTERSAKSRHQVRQKKPLIAEADEDRQDKQGPDKAFGRRN
jgi:hypothetical protein